MNHPICRVIGFHVLSSYTLRVTFDDETEQVIDFRPVLAGKLFGPLGDLTLFNQVRIDPEAHTLVWPNGADSILRRCMMARTRGGPDCLGTQVGTSPGMIPAGLPCRVRSPITAFPP